MEAINFNLPTFIFKNQVIAELFGNHPYAFTDWNAEHWADVIYEELNNNFENRPTSDIIEHLTWKRSADHFLELYRQLMSLEETAIVS